MIRLHERAIQAWQADRGWSPSSIDTCLAAKTSDACAALRSYVNFNPKGRWASRAKQAIRQAAPRIAQRERVEELAKARAAADADKAAPVEWPPPPVELDDPMPRPGWWD